MVTRFYFSATATPTVSPAFAAWGRTTEAARRTMSPTKDGSSLASTTIWAGDFVVAHSTALSRQFVSDPMIPGIAFTTSNTIKGVVRTMQSHLNDNIDRIPICLKVVSEDGSTTRATLKALSHYGPTAGEWDAVTLESRRFADGDTLDANYTTVAGDRLVLEIGGQISVFGGMSITGTLRFGSSAASDLPEDETTTTDDNPWFEIDVAISFGPTVSPAAANLEVEGFAPNITLEMTPATADIEVEGFAPLVVVGKVLEPAAADIEVEGFAPEVAIRKWADYKWRRQASARLGMRRG